jgi:precorrin-3B methylase
VLVEPIRWFHEVYRADGAPYRVREIEIIRKLTAASNGAAKSGRALMEDECTF